MPDQAPLPFPWGVLYAGPNKDGSQKKCGNCAFWVKDFSRCILHKRSLNVTQGMAITSRGTCRSHAPSISSNRSIRRSRA